MLKEIRLVLNKPYIDYNSTIVLSQLPEEMIYFKGNMARVSRFLEEDTHCGKGIGCFAVTDTAEYTGSIIQRVAALKTIGYEIKFN